MNAEPDNKDFAEGGDFITFDDRGDLDDIALTGVTMFRMERMSTNTFWVRLYRRGGKDIVFWLGAEPNEMPYHKPDPHDPAPCKIVGSYDLDYDDRPLWKRLLRIQ